MSRTRFAAEAVPVSWAMCVGPGDLAAMLGAKWQFSDETVWYEPCITDPATHPPLALDRDSFAFRKLTEMTHADLQGGKGVRNRFCRHGPYSWSAAGSEGGFHQFGS